MPEQWIVMEIGQVGEVVAGGTPSTKKDEYWGTDICWITPLDLSGYKEKYISKGRKSLTKLGLEKSSARLIPKDSILFSSRAPIGYVAVAANELATNQGFKNLIPSPIIESDFLYYYFKSIKKMAYELASGTTFKELSAARFAKIPVPVPPKKEQQVIVEKIEELFSDLDNAVENLQKAREQLKVYRQSILKNAFEGKLTNKNVKEGELPKGWKIFPLKQIVKTIDGDRGHNYPKKDEFYEEGYCLFLSTKNVRQGKFVFEENIFISKEKDEILKGGKLQLNDVVVTTRGTLGNVALYDNKIPFKNVRLNSGMLILRVLNQQVLDNYYLMKFISSPFFNKQLKEKQSGTAQPQIPANVLREIQIPLPSSTKEQKTIVAEIESRFSVCDQMEETIETSLKQAEALRQSILKQAFDGKLTEQWRKDYPDLISGENSAAALLAKIKAEKEALKKKK
ncbi:MAG TPA: restriction endonuclease subunit S [Smithella sp.]|nr:restriction endonuclease subunit S [Smithella sp.]